MDDQPEFDLPTPSARAPRHPKRAIFAGFTRTQLLLGILTLAALVWGMWITRLLITPRQDHIVSARLSAIVGDYVQAQARSASPPAQVEAEMRRFMASLDHELQNRSARGEIVLVGEAVLTRNVPDITESLEKAVYASGVPRPRQADANDIQRLDQQAMTASAPQNQTPTAGLAGDLDPMAPIGVMPGATMPQAAAPQYGGPAATVSTFGGSGGSGDQ